MVLYHRSFATNQLRALTLDAKGVPAGGVKGFDVSADGRFVVFVADDGLLGGTGQSGLFRHDVVADQVVALNVDASGKPLSSQDVVPTCPVFSTPRISADGKRVIVRAPEFPGSHHGLVKSLSDDKDTGLFLWQE
jgi:Tol biopolymer transport system component